MPAKFTAHIREFIASALLTSIDSQRTQEWTTNTNYNIGTKVTANGNLYVASSTGLSGGSIPSHISGEATDGNVNWIYVERAQTDKLFEGNMFMGIGQPTEWTDPLDPDEVVAIDSVENAALSNLVSLRELLPSNMKACIKRVNWTSGTIYDQYMDTNEYTDYVRDYFVVTDDNHVFKCLDNNSGAQSTSKPSNLLTTPFRTVDGYVWKYMATVAAADANIFMTADYVPVEVKKSSLDGAEQWAVQQSAQTNSISAWTIKGTSGSFSDVPFSTVYGNGAGATASAVKNATTLTQVYVNNPGSGYSQSQTYAIVKNGAAAGSGAAATANIDASGTITSITVDTAGSGYDEGAVAIIVGTSKAGTTLTAATGVAATVVGNQLSSVTFTNGGLNYATATVYIIPGTAGAVAYPIMAPASGHGYNIVRELNASTVMISCKLTNTINDTGYYMVGTESQFHQITILTDVIDKSTDKYAIANMYIGPSHPEYGNTSSTLNKVKSGTGVMLYINNIKKVERTADQEEDIKVAITL